MCRQVKRFERRAEKTYISANHLLSYSCADFTHDGALFTPWFDSEHLSETVLTNLNIMCTELCRAFGEEEVFSQHNNVNLP